MKKNIDFYQHYVTSDQHPKFKMLRCEYGWSGEGRFWALLNEIATSEDCLLDTNDSGSIIKLSNRLDMTIEQTRRFIKFLTFDCELIHAHSPFITTKGLQKELLKTHKNKNMRLYNVNVKAWKALTKIVFKRDYYQCQYCGQLGGQLECDHIVPISRGGTNDLSNLTTACQKCNRQKKDKSVEEFLLWREAKGA